MWVPSACGQVGILDPARNGGTAPALPPPPPPHAPLARLGSVGSVGAALTMVARPPLPRTGASLDVSAFEGDAEAAQLQGDSDRRGGVSVARRALTPRRDGGSILEMTPLAMPGPPADCGPAFASPAIPPAPVPVACASPPLPGGSTLGNSGSVDGGGGGSHASGTGASHVSAAPSSAAVATTPSPSGSDEGTTALGLLRERLRERMAVRAASGHHTARSLPLPGHAGAAWTRPFLQSPRESEGGGGDASAPQLDHAASSGMLVRSHVGDVQTGGLRATSMLPTAAEDPPHVATMGNSALVQDDERGTPATATTLDTAASLAAPCTNPAAAVTPFPLQLSAGVVAAGSPPSGSMADSSGALTRLTASTLSPTSLDAPAPLPAPAPAPAPTHAPALTTAPVPAHVPDSIPAEAAFPSTGSPPLNAAEAASLMPHPLRRPPPPLASELPPTSQSSSLSLHPRSVAGSSPGPAPPSPDILNTGVLLMSTAAATPATTPSTGTSTSAGAMTATADSAPSPAADGASSLWGAATSGSATAGARGSSDAIMTAGGRGTQAGLSALAYADAVARAAAASAAAATDPSDSGAAMASATEVGQPAAQATAAPPAPSSLVACPSLTAASSSGVDVSSRDVTSPPPAAARLSPVSAAGSAGSPSRPGSSPRESAGNAGQASASLSCPRHQLITGSGTSSTMCSARVVDQSLGAPHPQPEHQPQPPTAAAAAPLPTLTPTPTPPAISLQPQPVPADASPVPQARGVHAGDGLCVPPSSSPHPPTFSFHFFCGLPQSRTCGKIILPSPVPLGTSCLLLQAPCRGRPPAALRS